MPNADFSFKKIAIPAFGPSLLFGVGKGAVLPVIALSARDLGASVALAGLIVGLIGIGSLISNIPAALIIARFGERRSMMAAALVGMLGLACCVVPTNLWALAVGIFLFGMAQSVFFLARQTYLIELAPHHLRARAMSTLGGMMRIGVFIGPFLGAALMHFIGLSGAYVIAVAMMLGTGLLAASIADVAPSAARHIQSHGGPGMLTIVKKHWRSYATIGVGILLVSGIRASRQVIIPLWADGLGLNAATISIIFGLVAAVDMLLFYPSGKTMDKLGRRFVAIPSTLLMGSAMIAIPLTSGLISFTLAAMLVGVGNGIGSGLVMTLGADASPRLGRTQFLGFWRLMSDIGLSGSPLLLAAIMTAAGLAGASFAAGAMGYIAAGIFGRWLPHKPRDSA